MNWLNTIIGANFGILFLVAGIFAMVVSIQIKLKKETKNFEKPESQSIVFKKFDINKLRKYLFWVGLIYIVIGLVSIGINTLVKI